MTFFDRERYAQIFGKKVAPVGLKIEKKQKIFNKT
jgi:hypothetical protein